MYVRFNTFPLHLGPAAKYIELQTIFTLFLHLPSIRLLQCSIPHIFHSFTIIVIIMIAITMIMRTRPILQLPNSHLLLSSSSSINHFLLNSTQTSARFKFVIVSPQTLSNRSSSSRSSLRTVSLPTLSCILV